MCNEIARRIALHQVSDAFAQLRITLRFPEGAPNLAPLDSVRITDTTAIVRAATPDDAAEAELVVRRWSWPGSGGRPVYNYRSEGRTLTNHGAKGGRCLVPVSGFYEFTAPRDTTARRKDKWHFTPVAGDILCVAGLWRADPAVGEAFTLLTCEPGPDIAPYHARQIVLMPPDRWAAWLGGEAPAETLIAPSPAGTLAVDQVR